MSSEEALDLIVRINQAAAAAVTGQNCLTARQPIRLFLRVTTSNHSASFSLVSDLVWYSQPWDYRNTAGLCCYEFHGVPVLTRNKHSDRNGKTEVWEKVLLK